jgi:hypothetical protein
MSYLRFDRHEVFTSEDRTLVLDIIGELSKVDHPTEVNMLFGLFDGYWYTSLEKLIQDTTIDLSMVLKLKKLLSRVSVSISSKLLYMSQLKDIMPK